MLRRRRRARTHSLPKHLALFLTFLPSTPPPPANTPIIQIPNHRQGRRDHHCTPLTANHQHPHPLSSPHRPTHSMGRHSHLHRPIPPTLRRFRHRLHLSLILLRWMVTVLSSPGQGLCRLPHLTRILFRHTPTVKCAHSHLVHRTLGSVSVTYDLRSTRNSTTRSFPNRRKGKATRLPILQRLERWVWMEKVVSGS